MRRLHALHEQLECGLEGGDVRRRRGLSEERKVEVERLGLVPGGDGCE